MGVSVKCLRDDFLQFFSVNFKIWPAGHFRLIPSIFGTSMKFRNFLRSLGFSRAATRGAIWTLHL